MNTSIIGIAIAVFAVLIAIIIEGASLLAFLKPSSILLILGGTFGATFASYSLPEIKKFIFHFWEAMGIQNHIDLVKVFQKFIEIARKDGLLALEEEINRIAHPFLAKGIKLVVDGSDPRTLEEILMEYAEEKEMDESISAKILDTAGGYSPTVGIIGTVLGLVHVLENLGAGTQALGQGIATAFIATFYGIAFANLVFLPLGNKLRSYAKSKAKERHAIIRGIVSLQAGENRRILLERMEPFLNTED
jgi:chemotaxis protein MotA